MICSSSFPALALRAESAAEKASIRSRAAVAAGSEGYGEQQFVLDQRRRIQSFGRQHHLPLVVVVEPGELVFVRLDRVDDLQSRMGTIPLILEFQKGGVALFRIPGGSSAVAPPTDQPQGN
mgnify:CR=1 FL=1